MEFLSGNKVKVIINPAPFKEAIALKNAIIARIDLKKIDLAEARNKGFAEAIKGDLDIEPFIQALINIDSDESVNKALLECLARCTYGGVKITENTFDSVEAREDYYEIIFHCIKVNLHPFLKGLISKLSNLGNQLLNANPISQ